MTTEHKEQLRDALILELAGLPARALSVSELTRRIQRKGSVDVSVEVADVQDALALLEGLALVRRVQRPLSGLHDFQITAEGTLFREKNYA